jgi:hypothetical protein
MNKKAEILIIRKNNNLQGYLVIQVPGEKKESLVVEYAGDRKAITDTINHIFNRYDIQKLKFNIPSHDTKLLYMFNQKNIKTIIKNTPGTIKIINFSRLMERLRPYLKKILGGKKTDAIRFVQDKNKFSICFGQEKFSADEKSLEQIVFGTYNGKEKEIIPKNREISKILNDIFPLPFPWSGLNYV